MCRTFAHAAYVSIRQHTYISRSSTLDLDVEAQGGGRRVGHEPLPLRQRRASVVTL
jgi:hypothetical protein